MRRPILIALFAFLAPAAPFAQETSTGDVFLGYSHLRAMSEGVNGWNASFVANPSRHVGIVADLAGYYKDGAAIHSFMFGPRFTYHRDGEIEPVTPFAHVLVGGSLATSGVTDSIFTVAFGGGLDFRLAPKLALRLPQVDFLMARDDGMNAGAFRLSLGVVFRF